jgi:hypothetical protein
LETKINAVLNLIESKQYNKVSKQFNLVNKNANSHMVEGKRPITA